MTLAEILSHIQRHSKIYEKDIGQFFKDYDKLRKGYVSVDKFKHCLSILNLDLTEH